MQNTKFYATPVSRSISASSRDTFLIKAYGIRVKRRPIKHFAEESMQPNATVTVLIYELFGVTSNLPQIIGDEVKLENTDVFDQGKSESLEQFVVIVSSVGGETPQRNRGSLQQLASLNTGGKRSLPHILLPARFGCSLK